MPRAKGSKGDGRGDFFAVDSATWNSAIGLGINAAIALLVVARGTAADNRTSQWSANAIEKFTNISRGRAAEAIRSLIEAGILNVQRPGQHPIYVIGHGPADAKLDNPIWIPNVLIDGTTENARPPLELVRQTQNVAALKLLIDLYSAHELENEGGLRWRAIWQTIEKVGTRESENHAILCFIPQRFSPETLESRTDEAFTGAFFTWLESQSTGRPVHQLLFGAIDILRGLRLLEFVPVLVESLSDSAEVIMPIANETGEPAERRVGQAAHRAALRLVGENAQGGMMVPVPPHQRAAEAVGLVRLAYKPKTSATAKWHAKMAEWEALADQLDRVARVEIEVCPARFAG